MESALSKKEIIPEWEKKKNKIMTLKDFHVIETVYWFVNSLWYTFYISTAKRLPGSDSCLKLDSEISFHLWSVFALLGLHDSCFWQLACIQTCSLILNQRSSSVLLRGQGLLGASKSKVKGLAALPSWWQPYRQTKWHLQAPSLVYLWDYFSLCLRPVSPVG